MRIIRITLSMLVLSASTCAAQDMEVFKQSSSTQSEALDSLLDIEFKLTPVELDISEELIKAKDHYENGEWQAAVESATKFLKNKPGHKQTPDGLFLRGESYVQLQQYENVLRDFQQLLKSNGNQTQRIRAEFRIAEATMLLQKPVEAQRLLEEFRQRYPNDTLNAYVITYLGEIIGRTNRDWAKALYVESLQRYPNGPLYRRAKLRLALIRFKEGNHTIARSDLEQLIETGDRTNPEFWTAWYWLGRSELELGQADAAIERFLSFSEQFPNHEYAPAAVFQAAEAYRGKENPQRATELYQQLRQNWPDGQYKGAALLGEMRVLKQQGQHQTALNLFESFDNYSSPETRMQATQIATEIYLAKKSYKKAEQLISPFATVPQSLRTEAERTRHYTNLYLLALAHRGQGKYPVASEMLGRVRLDSVSPDLAERVMLARIETLVAAEEYTAANQKGFEFESRFANSKLLPAVRSQMIRSFIATKRNNEANVKFRQLQNMQDAEIYTARAARFLGESAYQQGDLDNARIAFQALQRHQQSDDDLSQSISGLAWIDFKQNKIESAAKGFGQFIDAFPEHPTIWQVRLAHADTLTKLERTDEAIEVLEPFETLPMAHPVRARGLYELAELLKNEPQSDGRVAQILNQILADHPTFEQRDAALYFSAMQDRKQKNVSATTKFKELVQQHQSSKYWSDALYRLAESAHSQKDNTAANRYLTKLISAEQDTEVLPHALFMKGRLESDAKNWSVARETLRELLRKFPNSKLVPVARYGVAESFFQEKEFDRAYQLFDILNREQKFDKADTWGAMVQLRCAQLEVQRKNLTAATTVAKQIETDYPDFSLQHEVDYLVGRVAAAQGDFSDARVAYEKVVSQDSTYEREISAMAQWMIGETYFHQKKYILAIKAYEALLADLKYDNWQAASHLQIGKCYELLENPEQAQNSYTRVTTRHGQSKWASEAKQRLDVLKQAG